VNGPAELVVDGDADEVLLRSAAALRRMGARLARYDAETLALEARLARWRLGLVLRVSAVPEGAGRTRLRVAHERLTAGAFDLGRGRRVLREFETVLGSTDPPDLTRRR
jgi:hypothetical protein